MLLRLSGLDHMSLKNTVASHPPAIQPRHFRPISGGGFLPQVWTFARLSFYPHTPMLGTLLLMQSFDP